MNVVIIGSGNVATVFAWLLFKHQHTILQVYSRNILMANELAETVDAIGLSDLSTITQEADLYIIAVADKAIESIVKQLQLSNQLVVHTAGSVAIEVLEQVSSNYGVLYPIQSIRKEIDLDTPIPFAVDGSSIAVVEQLERAGICLYLTK
ncbi:MAG: NAD(P)-binding domain-containing protein [Chitinophagaceae bacterium]